MLDFLAEQAYTQFHYEQAFNTQARANYLGSGRGKLN